MCLAYQSRWSLRLSLLLVPLPLRFISPEENDYLYNLLVVLAFCQVRLTLFANPFFRFAVLFERLSD